MRVKLIAWTVVNEDALFDETRWTPTTSGATWPEVLSEFAGRACYEAWERKNPATATNETYLRHILEVGHESVLEHASFTFYVQNVSRSLLLELERHRHLSFSVRSQRFVDERNAQHIVPPALEREWELATYLRGAVQQGQAAYQAIVTALELKGVPRKQAREAARATLPNAVETRFVVTGNIRAWRYVIRLRNHEAADAEIREFAREVLRQLKAFAPAAFQDMEVESCESRPPLSPA